MPNNCSQPVNNVVAGDLFVHIFLLHKLTNLICRPTLGGCQDWAKRVERALTDAKKDNDFIYHERIPEVKALTSIGRAAVVKPTAVPDTFLPGEKVGIGNCY